MEEPLSLRLACRRVWLKLLAGRRGVGGEVITRKADKGR